MLARIFLYSQAGLLGKPPATVIWMQICQIRWFHAFRPPGDGHGSDRGLRYRPPLDPKIKLVSLGTAPRAGFSSTVRPSCHEMPSRLPRPSDPTRINANHERVIIVSLQISVDEDRFSFEAALRSASVHSENIVMPPAERVRCPHQRAPAGDFCMAIALCSRVS